MYRPIVTGLLLATACFLPRTLFATAEEAAESHVVQLDADRFDAELPTKHHFVMFYAPWCGHCTRLKPTWEELATKLAASSGEPVAVAKVDCTVDTELCSKNDVTGYPTLKFFKVGAGESSKYRGPRDLASLQKFVADSLGVAVEEEEAEVGSQQTKGAIELTDENFVQHTAEGDHFVKFFAPWCGHCQKLAPTWENLAQSLEQDTGVSIAKVDCTLHRSLCNTFEIKGYPTLLWIRDGKKLDKYQGSRSHDDLKAFVSKMRRGAQQPAPAAAADPPAASGDAGKVPNVVTSPVVQLVEANFANGIASGVTFVKFYAPWCGHCQRMAPTWEELGAKFAASTRVKIAKVDCTEATSRQLCAAQQVNGFPTVFLYRDGAKVEEYDGNRSLDDMHSFVTRHLGRDEL